MSAATNRSENFTPFLLRRLHSLSGIFPIGVFLLYHFYFSLYAWQGPAVYNAKMESLRNMPSGWAYLVFEFTCIYLPIMFHGLYGLILTKDARVNLQNYPLFGNLNYVLQRLSGVGLLLFIGVHVTKARLLPMLNGSSNQGWQHLNEALSFAQSGPIAVITGIVYFLGVIGVAYHLTNGLWLFAIRWGIVQGEESMKKFRGYCLAFGVSLFAWGMASIAGFIWGGTLGM